MWRLIGIAWLLLGVPSSGSAREAVLSVEQVLADLDHYDGQLVHMRGWVNHCRPLGCHLYASPERDSASIPIGGSKEFDASIVAYPGRQIVVEARLDAKCIRPKSDLICLDRVDALHNPTIIEVR